MNRLNFAENFNAQGTVSGLKSFLRENINKISSYPDYRYSNLINTISQTFKIPDTNIAIGAGTTEILFTLPHLLQGKVLIIAPTFWEYSLSNKRAGNKIDYYISKEEKKFEIDFNNLQRKIGEVDAVYFCNPNNPTSTIIPKDKLIFLIKKNPSIHFVIDETYMIFRDDYDDVTVIREANNIKNLYVVTSFSKIFSIPGLRSGFLVSYKVNIKKFRDYMIPYSCNPLANLATIYCLNDKQFLRKTRTFYKRQRSKAFKLFSDGLRKKLKIFYPKANFILAKILVEKNSVKLTNELEENDILIRDCSEFLGLGEKWIRFAIRKDKENDILLTTLQRLL